MLLGYTDAATPALASEMKADMPNDRLEEEMTAWRRSFHRSPGIRFDVGETAGTVASLLGSFGLDVETGVGETGVVGVLRRGISGRSVGFRADMDALPIQTTSDAPYRSQIDGRHHGCGHDGHTAMLLGAAKRLSETGQIDGTVHFIFQPNEEEGLGAQAMIDDGLFDRWNIEEIYGMHCAPGLSAGHFALRAGPMMTFEDNFVIHVQGRGGHSSAPHLGSDAMVAGAEIVTALQTVVARSLNPMESGVVSVTEFETDGSRNVIPSNVTIRGDTRGLDRDVQRLMEERMGDIVGGICIALGVNHTFQYTNELIAMVNTPDETSHAAAAARFVVGDLAVNADCPPSTASEDFARMLEHRPGCYVLIGNGTEGKHGLPWHNPGFEFNDAILTVGADYWRSLAEMRLREP